MKLVRYSDGSGTKLGVVKGDGVIDLGKRWPSLSDDMIGLINLWSEVRGAVSGLVADAPADAALADVHLLAPVPRPGKIMAIGLNYADHVQESGQKTPPHQIWFTKAVTAINGPFDPIQLPIASEQTDYEAELVVIIGQRCKHVTKARAAEAVFGYCAGNDVSVRDWQLRTSQWALGKSFDTHAPIGPWIVTSDELGDPHTLGIRCFVNGEQRQNSNTSNLIFNVFDQIELLSRAMTLEPGDVIFTGTPGGVGMAMKPPRLLKAGDKVRVEIDRIGAIEGITRAENSPEDNGPRTKSLLSRSD
jgi:2-keto-4-pentenoate hydratase/2-oxohepta-3-ene-1,7-dioic acid hydratase in catechol pathway